MLTVLICKDESTQVPRQVEDMAAARALMVDGMPCYILGEDGARTLLTAEDAPAVEPAAPVDEPDFPPAA